MGTTKKGAKTTKAKTATKKGAVKENTNETTEASITKEKELKYNYPTSCEGGKNKDEVLIRRKAFRQKVRKAIERFEKRIAKLQEAKEAKEKGAATELNNIKKELKAFMEEVYTPGYLSKLS